MIKIFVIAQRDRAHGYFVKARNTKLAHDPYIEGEPEHARNFVRDRNASTRQCEYEHRRAICIVQQSCCQLAASLDPVFKSIHAVNPYVW